MAQRFWVGGTATWDGTAGTKWATTSGGAGGAAVPGSTDDVFFDANSGSVTVTGSAAPGTINSIDCTGFVGTLDFSANATVITVVGSVKFVSGMTLTSGNVWSLLLGNATSSGNQTITTGGKQLAAITTQSAIGAGSSATWTLQDDLTSINIITVSGGHLNFNGYNVAAIQLFDGGGSTARRLSLESSTVTLSGTVNFTGTNFTLDATNSTIVCTNATATINGNGKAFETVKLTGGAGTKTINGANTFAFLTYVDSGGGTTLAFGADQVVTGALTVTGLGASQRTLVKSTVAGTQRSLSATIVNLTDVDFTDIAGSGTAAPFTGTRIGQRRTTAGGLNNCTGVTFTPAATKFWVGGTGNWSTNHWALSSGGVAAAANFPLPQDSVVFDALSNATAYTVTFDQAVFLTDLNFSAAPLVSGTITWAGSLAMDVAGSLTLLSGMVRSYLGTITFNATSTGKSITWTGISTSGVLTFDGSGGGWTFQDSNGAGGSSAVNLNRGTLTLNGKSLTTSAFTSTGVGVRTLDLTGSTILGVAGASWNVDSNLTLTIDTASLITATYWGAFTGGGLTYNDVTMSAMPTSVSVGGTNTFRNLSVTSSSSPVVGVLSLPAGTQTVTGLFTASGNSASNRLLVQSTQGGQGRTINAAAVALQDVDFSDITGAGAATWSGTRVGDARGNSGITFTPGTQKFYVGNTANWNAANVWALSSGGAGATVNFPLAQDTAIFDANSFSANGQLVTISSAFRIGSVDYSAVTKTGIVVTHTASPTYFGDVTLIAGLAVNGTGTTSTFSGRNTQRITSAGVTWNPHVTVDSIGGIVQLADSLTLANPQVLTLSRGTLVTGDNALTCGQFTSTGSNARTLTLGAGNLTLTGANVVWNISASLTLNKGSGYIVLNDSSATNKIFAGSGLTYNSIWFTGTGTGTFDVTGNNTFNELRCDSPPHTVRLPSAGTTKINSLAFYSRSGALITLTTPAAVGTLSMLGTGIICADWLSISNITVTQANTFFAGANSTDGGGNTNIVFSAGTMQPANDDDPAATYFAGDDDVGDDIHTFVADDSVVNWDRYEEDYEEHVLDEFAEDEQMPDQADYFFPPPLAPPQPCEVSPSELLGDDDLGDEVWQFELPSEQPQQAPVPPQPYEIDFASEFPEADVGDDAVWFDVGANDQQAQYATPLQPWDEDWFPELTDEVEGIGDDSIWHDVGAYDVNVKAPVAQQPREPEFGELSGEDDLGDQLADLWSDYGNEEQEQAKLPLQPWDEDWYPELSDDAGEGDETWSHDVGANDAQYATPLQPWDYDPESEPGVIDVDAEVDDWWTDGTPSEQGPQAPTPQQPYELDAAAELVGDDDVSAGDEALFAEVGANDQGPQAPKPPQPEEARPYPDFAGDDDLGDESIFSEVGANDLQAQNPTPPQPDEWLGTELTSDDEPDDWWHLEGANDAQAQYATPPAPDEFNWTAIVAEDGEADEWWPAEVNSSDLVPKAPTPQQPREFDGSAEGVGDDDLGDESSDFEVGANDLVVYGVPPAPPTSEEYVGDALTSDEGEADDWWHEVGASDLQAQYATPAQPAESDGSEWLGDDVIEADDWWHAEGANDAVSQAPTPPQPWDFDAGAESVGDDDLGDDSWFHEVGSSELEEQAPTPPQPRESDGSEWLGDDALEADDWLLDGAPFEQGPQGSTPDQPREFAGDELTSDEGEADDWWLEEPGVNEEQPEAPTPPQPGEYEAADAGDDQAEVDEWWHLVGSEDLLVYGVAPSHPATDANADFAFLGDDDVSSGDEAMYFDQGNEADVPYPYRRFRATPSDAALGGAVLSDAPLDGAKSSDAAIGGANLSEGI